MYKELMMARSRPQPSCQPVAAQLLSTSTGLYSGMVTGSIIWPMAPSPRSMVGVRYLSATSKAFMVSSTASCTVAGAKTGMR